MTEVLFVSKPVAPPWNDSSKNLVRDIAGHLRRHTPLLMGRSGQENPLGTGRVINIYPTEASSSFSPSLGSKLRVFGHLLSASSPDIWHFFFAPSSPSSTAVRFAKALRRIPSVHTLCSLPREGSALRRLVFADVTVALSQFAYDRFHAEIVHDQSLRMIPPSVPPLPEPGRDERARLRMKHGLSASAAIWIYPGDLEFGGGAEVALGGFAAWNFSDAVLLMACRNKTARAEAERARLRRQAKQLFIDDRVRWVGETLAIRELLALSDFVVLPSRSPYAKTDYPLVVLEAMCMARPVIVADGTPAAELVHRGGAIAVEPSADALAATVARLADDEEGRNGLGKRARRLALGSFSPTKVAAAYERLYEELHD